MRKVGLVATASAVMLAIGGVVLRTQAQKPDASGHAQVVTVQTQVATLNVPDMFCGGCEAAVKMAANKVNGVKAVKTDSDKRIAEVTFDPSKTSAAAIAAAITKGSGFKTEVPKTAKDTK